MNQKIILLSMAIGIVAVFLYINGQKNQAGSIAGWAEKKSEQVNTINNSGTSEKENSDVKKTEESTEAEKKEGEIIYYYGETCPHCHKVLKFLDENKIASKVNFQKKEVWKNEENRKEFEEKIKECGLDKGKVGVPFLYARGKCLIGSPDVIEFFKKEAEMI